MTNICQPIVDVAQKHPEHLALQAPHSLDHGRGLSFQEFFSHASHFQHQLTQAGFVAGDRLLVIIQPGLVLYPLLIAILGLGLVPVMLERGLSKKQLREILRRSKLSAVITQPTLGKFWFLIPELWRLRRFVIGQRIWGMKALETPSQHLSLNSFICRDLPLDTTGLITFTSGSTGIPKGANRTHDSLLAQLDAITALFSEGKSEIDLHSFPVMVLHSLCCGNSSILPDFDFAHPATVDPQKIVRQVQDNGVTCLSGAPAYMSKVTGYAKNKGLSFPNVRTVIVGGAPANKALLENCLTVFPHARHLVVYGSTEVEPISTVEMTTQLNHWAAHDGYLVGKPVTQAEICIREITANPQQIIPLPAGNAGEILVAGPHVLKDYIDNPQATKENKLPRKQGGIWHCTGDVGYLDTTGQLWLLGRVKDKVVLDDGRIIHPYVLEKRINELPEVTQNAFVLHPLGGAALILESATLPTDLPAILDELDLTRVTRIYYINSIPVDIRHNSKINRIALINMLAKGQLSSVPHKEKL
ncbi:fatty acid CoA ligase family protein [Photorhabdus sp. APURE]|uniref:fatty acid CoA ligase family protein n=1 Tax=Photorhabdus aballayi TaxID=2991723 RepID=UPI00223E5829|nr:fatty acid CoA ligase family protein [Photorhabdus aballayi]MCW7547192.1 fatty acid CoA ligase family protein [Photorhabdus aballayi]